MRFQSILSPFPKSQLLVERHCVCRAPGREAVFPGAWCHAALVVTVAMQGAAAEALVPHLPGVLHGGPDPAPQDAGAQGARPTRGRGPGMGCLRARGWEGRRPAGTESQGSSLSLRGHPTEVWLLNEAVVFLLWVSVSPSFRHHLAPPLSHGAPLSTCALSCLLSVAICCAISEPVAQGRDVLARALVQGLSGARW